MITAAAFSASSEVRNLFRGFFRESHISHLISCSGLYQAFFDHVIKDSTQMAIIDITGMNSSALSVINRIYSYNPKLDIIILHRGAIEENFRKAIHDTGVCRIICCDSSICVSRDISSAVSSHFADSIYSLSCREQQVLRLISEGMKTNEIAEIMGISSTTVTVYRKKIAKKIGSNNIAIQTRTAITISLSRL
ncbi:MAG: helix-turn-helix transcriptional regulator [Spirochaetales bacterium]|nr:helix-turn-helix transcriptional regulator [Spirochaetales bacterium]